MRGTLVLLEELARRPATRFVFASSSSVYGVQRRRCPFTRGGRHPPPGLAVRRDQARGRAPRYTHHHLYGIPTTCLRFFTVYGPRQRPEMAIHAFVRDVLAGRPIPFFGDGSTRRDYTYVDDVDRRRGAGDRPLRGLRDLQPGRIGDDLARRSSSTMIGAVCERRVRLDRASAAARRRRDHLRRRVSKARERLGYRPAHAGRERAWRASWPGTEQERPDEGVLCLLSCRLPALLDRERLSTLSPFGPAPRVRTSPDEAIHERRHPRRRPRHAPVPADQDHQQAPPAGLRPADDLLPDRGAGERRDPRHHDRDRGRKSGDFLSLLGNGKRLRAQAPELHLPGGRGRDRRGARPRASTGPAGDNGLRRSSATT